MTKIVLIEKNGELKGMNVKELSRDNLFKKCGFKKPTGFEMRFCWVLEINSIKYNVEIWSKKEGKAGSENKYDLPPPVDKDLYFGTMALISYTKKDVFIDLDVELWKEMYEKLFGGFEDLNKEEDKSEDELENIPVEKKTKSGYLKDGFVVEDKTEKKHIVKGCDLDEEDDDEEDDEYSYTSSELEEEEYQYSSDDE